MMEPASLLLVSDVLRRRRSAPDFPGGPNNAIGGFQGGGLTCPTRAHRMRMGASHVVRSKKTAWTNRGRARCVRRWFSGAATARRITTPVVGRHAPV